MITVMKSDMKLHGNSYEKHQQSFEKHLKYSKHNYEKHNEISWLH